MIYKSSYIKGIVLVVSTVFLQLELTAQQDPQFTHYMYNTMTVNPGYAGQREVLSITGLYRTQWVGIDGAPETLTFGAHSPLRNKRLGLGLNIVSDRLGPAKETSIDANFSYTIPVNIFGQIQKLSFGLKGGIHSLETNWNNIALRPGRVTPENLSLASPTIGGGLYLHSQKWYLGISVPNILDTDHFDEIQESVAKERLHFFLIGGYVFDLDDKTKLKPALLVKGVSGAPLIADISISALFNNKFTLGLAYRWDDSISGMLGLQVSQGLLIGYSYDFTTTGLNSYNNGTHEIMLRFELPKFNKLVSPRFF